MERMVTPQPRLRSRASDFIDAPLRGAPLAVVLVLVLTGSGVVAAGVDGASVWVWALLAVLLATLCISPIWMSRLAELRWPVEPPAPRWFEQATRLTAFLSVVGVILATGLSAGPLPWILFGAHCVFTAVAIPVELRRYPGVIPRAVR